MGMFEFDDRFTMFDITPLENQFILEYMPTAKGDYVKVYLYGLLHCYHPQNELTVERAAHDLGLSEQEVMQAFRYWERCRLVKRVQDQPPMFRYINVKQQFFMGEAEPADRAYQDFAEMLYGAFGNDRRLHGKEITLCYEWVEDLGLAPEVVLMIVKHMISIRGKQFSFSAAQKLATTLAEANARTIDDAEVILGREKQVWDGSRRVLRRMGKRRDPSEDEMNLYAKWYREWGYAPDAIEAACAETTKGDPTFAYLDGILRGMMQRTGKAAATGREVEENRVQEKERIAPLKKVLAVLGLERKVQINEGTLAFYDEMRAMYPDEIILLAAQQVSKKKNVALEDVLNGLEKWKQRNLQTLEDVEQYLRLFEAQNKLLREIYEALGAEARPNPADRALLQKWQEEWGYDKAFILACAGMTSGAEKPMPYLDTMLKSYHEQGIRTTEAAEAAHQAWQQQNAARQTEGKPVPRRTVKVVREQNYEQRSYDDELTIPEWMRAGLEAMDDDED